MFAALAMGAAAPGLNVSMLQLSIPAITADLKLALPEVNLLILVYGLGSAGGLIITARMKRGRGASTRQFGYSCALLAFAQLAMCVSSNIVIIAALRAFGGLAASLCIASSIPAFYEILPPKSRSRAIGAYSGLLVGVQLSAPVFSSIVLAAYGWRWACAVPALSSVLAVVLTIVASRFSTAKWCLPRPPLPSKVGRIEQISTILLLALVVSSLAGSYYTSSYQPDPVLLAIAAASFAILLAVYRQRELATIDPPVLLFTVGRQLAGLLLGVAVVSGIDVAMSPVVAYLMQSHNYEPSSVALVFSAMAAGAGIASVVAGWVLDRARPERLLSISPFLLVLSLGVLIVWVQNQVLPLTIAVPALFCVGAFSTIFMMTATLTIQDMAGSARRMRLNASRLLIQAFVGVHVVSIVTIVLFSGSGGPDVGELLSGSFVATEQAARLRLQATYVLTGFMLAALTVGLWAVRNNVSKGMSRSARSTVAEEG